MAKTLPRRDSQKRCVCVSVYIVHELGNAGRIFFFLTTTISQPGRSQTGHSRSSFLQFFF